MAIGLNRAFSISPAQISIVILIRVIISAVLQGVPGCTRCTRYLQTIEPLFTHWFSSIYTLLTPNISALQRPPHTRPPGASHCIILFTSTWLSFVHNVMLVLRLLKNVHNIYRPLRTSIVINGDFILNYKNVVKKHQQRMLQWHVFTQLSKKGKY